MLLDTEYIYHAQFPQTTPNHSNASERKVNHPVLTVIQSWGICGFGGFSLDLFRPRIRFQAVNAPQLKHDPCELSTSVVYSLHRRAVPDPRESIMHPTVVNHIERNAITDSVPFGPLCGLTPTPSIESLEHVRVRTPTSSLIYFPDAGFD